MNKKNVLATLALSTIALAQAGYVSADELAPIDSSAPATEVVTPTTPSASTETEAPATQPTEPQLLQLTQQHHQINHKTKTTQEVLTGYQQINQHLQTSHRIRIMQVASMVYQHHQINHKTKTTQEVLTE